MVRWRAATQHHVCLILAYDSPNVANVYCAAPKACRKNGALIHTQRTVSRELAPTWGETRGGVMIESSTMRRVCAVCAFAGMGLVPAALAQSEADEIETVPTIPVAALDPEDVPTEMDADTIELEELVVTAQKTRQTLREVPASVSAISGEQLAEANILLPNDVNNYVPNLTMKITPYLSEVRIRGYGTTISNLGAESSVGTVIDGVYYGRSTFLSSMLYDVGQFEVIRGPQGSLFGKNTIAGVLNLTTREPEPYSEASIRLIGTDNLDQRIAQGGVTIPLSDTAAVRIAGAVLRHRRDSLQHLAGSPRSGFQRNLRPYQAAAAGVRLWRPHHPGRQHREPVVQQQCVSDRGADTHGFRIHAAVRSTGGNRPAQRARVQ
ncbi:MAG: hypothetical protein CMP06_07650 [Xanthomonadales bacterium]|nr:hypothetical protein [Xanthomonadales bacterium]